MKASIELLKEIFNLLYVDLMHRAVNNKIHKEDPIILHTKYIDFLCNLITSFMTLEVNKDLYLEGKINNDNFIADVLNMFNDYYKFCDQIKDLYDSGEEDED